MAITVASRCITATCSTTVATESITRLRTSSTPGITGGVTAPTPMAPVAMAWRATSRRPRSAAVHAQTTVSWGSSRYLEHQPYLRGLITLVRYCVRADVGSVRDSHAADQKTE